jgi:hypothetical protein
LTNLPIRIRLTLVFACSMAIVLLATGAFLFVRVGNSLDHNVQEALETRSAELGTDLREGISISTSVLPDDQDEQFAQVVGTDGRVIDATSRVRKPVAADAGRDRSRGRWAGAAVRHHRPGARRQRACQVVRAAGEHRAGHGGAGHGDGRSRSGRQPCGGCSPSCS